VTAAALAAAAVIDGVEQLEEAQARRDRIYAELVAYRRRGSRHAEGLTLQQLADLVAEKLREMGYDDARQRARGVTADTLRRFVSGRG
jgi:hypothetical protein